MESDAPSRFPNFFVCFIIYNSQQTLHDLGIKIQDYNDALQSLQRMCTDEMRDTSKHDGKGQQKVSKSLIEPCDIQETVQAVKLKISG